MNASLQLKMAHTITRDEIKNRLQLLTQGAPPDHSTRNLVLGGAAGAAGGAALGGLTGLGAGYARGAWDSAKLVRDLFKVGDPIDAMKNITPRWNLLPR